jgi:hypothetical protein
MPRPVWIPALPSSIATHTVEHTRARTLTRTRAHLHSVFVGVHAISPFSDLSAVGAAGGSCLKAMVLCVTPSLQAPRTRAPSRSTTFECRMVRSDTICHEADVCGF